MISSVDADDLPRWARFLRESFAQTVPGGRDENYAILTFKWFVKQTVFVNLPVVLRSKQTV